MFDSIQLRDWQINAFDKWKQSGEKATVIAGTGAGKTMLGMMILHQNIDKSILIVVPTEAIQKQWRDVIINNFDDKFSIGFIGGGSLDNSKQITIAVINSIRDSDVSKDVLIMDEMHRYASKQNITFLEKSRFNKVLGLTATIERDDERHVLLLNSFPVCYTINQNDCINNGYLSKYTITNLRVNLTSGEKYLYDECDKFVKIYFREFDFDMQKLIIQIRRGDSLAAKVMKSITERKQILLNANNRIVVTRQIINENADSKIIVFGEYIDLAQKIYHDLLANSIKAGLYHSKLSLKNKKSLLEDFKNGNINILVSVKALDEGVDIPDCSVGIVVAGSSVVRQAIQRFGRILRAKEGKIAKIYQLYIPNTQDEKWVKSRLQSIDKTIPVIWK